MCVAAIKMSVESIIESHVSVYELMFPKHRTVSEIKANNSMMIKLNGPNLAHCITIVKNSLDKYFKSHNDCHFTVKSQDIKSSFQVSKVIDKKQCEISKLPFMDG